MEPAWASWALASVALVLGNALFVAVEYALIAARRSRIETLAKKGNRNAKALMSIFGDMTASVAGIQVAITMLGIGVGAVTEPVVRDALNQSLKGLLPASLVSAISIVLVTFTLVVGGELVPKVLALRHADALALAAVRPLNLFVTIFRPLVWASQKASDLVLLVFGVREDVSEGSGMAKDELALLVRSGASEGVLAKTHAELVAKALNLDTLAADDIMVHRMDVRWIPLHATTAELWSKIAEVPFTRIPVCGEDIDDIVGILYLHDFVRTANTPNFDLRSILRPVVSIPENLSIDKIVATMRTEKTQMLVVTDEYGGTSGLVTLEDVVEEVFGDLEDRLESDRAAIEVLSNGRVSARGDVRFDELRSKIGLEPADEPCTDTLAEIIIDGLGRLPKVGDRVPSPLGILRVDNMARRRITRVSLLRR